MKNIILAISLLFTISSNCQNYKIDYIFHANEIIDITLPSSLFVSPNFTYTYYLVDTSRANLVSQKDDEDIKTFNFLRNKNLIINKYNSIEKTYYFLGKVGSKSLYVEDKLPNINWKITSEAKYIMNYKCLKAEGSFRGRNWNAWFTTELPISIGPSKFQGLPGLILELYDNSGTYNIQAKKISTFNSKEEEFEIAYKNQFKDNYKTISLQEFLNLQKEYFDSVINETIGRENLIENRNNRKGLELIYEWEEEHKNN